MIPRAVIRKEIIILIISLHSKYYITLYKKMHDSILE